MSRKNNQFIHLKLLAGQISPNMTVHAVNRPAEGWLHTVRLAMGLSLKSVADILKLSPQAIHQVEKSEASGTISLKQLETVAGAMNCRLVYILIPRDGALADPVVAQAEASSRREPSASASIEGPGNEFPMALR